MALNLHNKGRRDTNFPFLLVFATPFHMYQNQNSTRTRLFIGFHCSLMCSTYCASAKDQFSIKTHFYEFACFMLMACMFVPNLKLIGHPVELRRKIPFSLKMTTDPCPNSSECKTWTLLLGSFCTYLKLSD